jgi:thiol-disulfide isomerase/thioredoxin
MVPGATDDSMVEDSIEAPAWQTAAITDVDGNTFTLADFSGRPVLVETFATWCPNCRAQLGTTDEVAAAAGEDAVVIALSVETDISADDVRAYAEDNGFSSIRFAVVTPEFLAALVDSFGPTVANPPATPKFVIDAMGHAGELTTGSESADALTAALGLA